MTETNNTTLQGRVELKDRISVNPAEAAALLGLSRQSIYNLISAGRLKPSKLGRRTLLKTEDLRDLLDNAA